MCCLFGLYDYGKSLSATQKSKIISALAVAAEARGTDAAGIAYLSGSHLSIYKCPLPAHRLRFRIPAAANVVMGHTRMTTQGSSHRNYNNHPFYGQTGSTYFALAHRNDRSLQVQKKLPVSKIETDSYVIVQLLERQASWTCRRSGLFQSFCAARLPIRFWTATRSFSSCAAITRFACTTFRRWASTSTLRRKRF